MGARLTAALALLVLGCGDSEPTAKPRPVVEAGPVSLEETAGDRLVVANVNGVPVYGDCVERQAEAHGLDARAALEECIDFELLAQAAARSEHRNDPDVLDVREREAVRAFVDDEFLTNFDGPEDVPMEHIRAYYADAKDKYRRDAERRVVQYARIELAQDVVRGSAADLEGKAVAERIYAALKGRTDLTVEEFKERSKELAAPSAVKFERAPFNFADNNSMVREFATATFEIPAPGMVHAPVRTHWGWDIILLIDIWPVKNIPIEEAEPEIRETIFEVSRMRSFVAWVASLNQAPPEVDMDVLQRLASAQQGNGMLGPTTPQNSGPQNSGSQ